MRNVNLVAALAFVAMASGAQAQDEAPPTVRVTAPNGGETVTGGTQLSINWTSSDNVGVASHDVDLSTDAGATFPIPVAGNLPGSAQTFNFLVPAAIDTTTARVRVTALDGTGNAGFDMSDANFTIRRPANADTEPPTVAIATPAPGDTLEGGATLVVTWTSSDNVGVATQNIDFSTDGVTFVPVATGLPGSAQTFQMQVPQVDTTTGTIRVVARDASGNAGSATVGDLIITANRELALAPGLVVLHLPRPSTTLTVTLTPARADAAEVALSAQGAGRCQVPASVEIAAGETSATFTITCHGLGSTVVVASVADPAVASASATVEVRRPSHAHGPS